VKKKNIIIVHQGDPIFSSRQGLHENYLDNRMELAGGRSLLNSISVVE
tara:strand:+ start:327 stop:470 length:144 start_codon:yes stop_codon:yes gene_type:complete